MSARQIIVLVIALAAAIGALFFVRSISANRAEQDKPAEQTETENVLVAARDIQQGAAVAAEDLAWRAFPKAAIGERFVRQTSASSALTDLTGAIARRAFSVGEPIIQGYVMPRNGGGFMAAMLPVGYRAISLEVDKAALAGGYIQPNDRVDVILTREIEIRGAAQEGRREEQVSEIVLENVRVMAIGDQSRPQEVGDAPQRIDSETITLELTGDDARLLAQADAMGEISIALRSVEAEPEGLDVATARRRGALEQNIRRNSVRVHGFSASGRGEFSR